MNDALLLVDVLNDFRHEDGARLAESFRDAHTQLRELLSSSREANLPIIYANDHFGDWTADGDAIVDRALAGLCGDLIPPIAPRQDDIFVIKPGYSVCDHRRSQQIADGRTGAELAGRVVTPAPHVAVAQDHEAVAQRVTEVLVGGRPGTFCGVKLVVRVPLPSWPLVFRPHDQTLPALSRA